MNAKFSIEKCGQIDRRHWPFIVTTTYETPLRYGLEAPGEPNWRKTEASKRGGMETASRDTEWSSSKISQLQLPAARANFATERGYWVAAPRSAEPNRATTSTSLTITRAEGCG